jgi:3-isopropylmalate/(R)-2-methylmalate dehydratase small subunit
VLDRADVDTDQILPKQFLKRIERTGFGEFLFFDWRFGADGQPRPEFELNRPEYAGARILIAGRNFGCGSSREHAPWSLQEYGFEALIAPSFADIFVGNCFKIGLLPVVLPADEVRRLTERCRGGADLTVDLERQVVVDPDGRELAFDVDPAARHRVLNGLDEIGLTLEHEQAITDYEAARPPLVSTASLPV